jgi:hypothetical protein
MGTVDSRMFPTGYAHPDYVASLAEFGVPRRLPRSGGWILERGIFGSDLKDAIGAYPLFVCSDWGALAADLDELGSRLVSLCVVPDPFGAFTVEDLPPLFPELARPYKEHAVVDFERPLAISRHHRKCAAQALRHIDVDVLHPDENGGLPDGFLDDWIALHEHLVARHAIIGISAFSRTAFERQLRLPGLVVIRARQSDVTVGAQLWLVHAGVAYGHVLALNPDGTRGGAGYALYSTAFDHFRDRVRYCDIGGVPDRSTEGATGLEAFKRGWSPETRTTWLCGRVFDRPGYDALVSARSAGPSQFFPAYRDRL